MPINITNQERGIDSPQLEGIGAAPERPMTQESMANLGSGGWHIERAIRKAIEDWKSRQEKDK